MMLRTWRARWRSLGRRRWAGLYLALLLLSHAVILGRAALVAPDPLPPSARELTLPRFNDRGPIPGSELRLVVHSWPAPAQGQPAGPRAPVLMLHGSPSRGGLDFERFAPLLNARGLDVYAIDLPGYGRSDTLVPRYSFPAHARAVLAAMDELKIDRAHVVGWSYGSAVALTMADLEESRLASLTMMGGIGVQETEGSGDYYFEHLKYGIGWVLVAAMPEFIPHFGLLGTHGSRAGFIRSYWDSDQRPIRAVMDTLTIPTLILHGRKDFLVPAWAAEEHHRLIEESELVMLGTGHFLPLGPPMQPRAMQEEVADRLAAFVIRHHDAAAPDLRSTAILAPSDDGAEEAGASKLGRFTITRDTHWAIVIFAIIVLTFVSEDLTVILVSLLIAKQHIDIGVGLLGCFIAIVLGDFSLWALGRFVGRRILHWPIFRRLLNEDALERWGRVFDTHTGKAVLMARCVPGTRLPTYLAAGILSKKTHQFFFWVAVAVFLWTPFLFVLTMVIGRPVLNFFEKVLHGPWAIVAALLVLAVVIRLISYEATDQGRNRLKADLKRLVSSEFWPAWIFYLPMIPYGAWLALRSGGPTVFTCANPALPMGGGVIGESKKQIHDMLERAGVEPLAYTIVVPEGIAARRAERVRELVRTDASLGGYPVILKPDAAFRGHGLKLARNDHDVDEYFKDMTRAALLQRYHPGPEEVGVLWARVPRAGARVEDWPGEIFSVTRKTFPSIVGDGRSTLEQLIWHHPRYRLQASTFLKRHAGRTDLVVPEGERVRLAIAGNHCQGTLFTDGADLITPALTDRLSAIANAIRLPGGERGFDFGRFDLRYESDEALKRGEGFVVIELNGTISESTNMYDPGKTIWWRYRLLFAHWRRLAAIGAARRREGVRVMTFGDLRRAIREHYHGRPGSPVAD